MKTASLPLISLLLLLLANCSPSSTDPNAILTRLLEARMTEGEFVKQPSGKDTLKYYGPEDLVLIGTSRVVNDHLVVTIYTEALEMEHWYTVAVYAPDETSQWTPVFAEEVVHGRLDTIIDLNGDQRPEFIVDEYNGNSAGFNSVQMLYARLDDSNTYDRIDTLSVRWNGGSAYNMGRAVYSYEPGDNSTMIVVNTEVTDFGEEGTPVTAENVYLLYWQPPHLNREDSDPPPERPVQAVDLVEAQSVLEELYDIERRKGLLAISYNFGDGEYSSERIELYFAGSLSDIRFRDSMLTTGEESEDVFIHREFNDNNVIRATKRIDGGESPGAILFYVMDEQEHVVSLDRHATLEDNWGYAREVPTNNIPGDEPAAASVNYEFDPDSDKTIAFIREHAEMFTPGKKYVFEAMGDMGGTRYEVDSLLWVREFGKE